MLYLTALLLLATLTTAQRLGGIDMQRACRDQYGSVFYAVRGGNGCNDWYCDANVGLENPIDVLEACKRQYEGKVLSRCEAGAEGWGCWQA